MAPSVLGLATRQREILDFLRPKPFPLDLVNIGGNADGGYLVPDDFHGIDACFSPGVGGTKSFEDELWARFGVRSHMADYSVDEDFVRTQLINGAQTFEKKWLAPHSDEISLSLEDWVRSREKGAERNLLLQMDIEGAEYGILSSVRQETLDRFRFLVIEIHNLADQLNVLSLGGEFDKAMASLSAGFLVVHARQNNCCPREWVGGLQIKVPQVVEVTLASRVFLDALDGGAEREALIPHPKDISRNVRHKPPAHLSGLWTSGRMATASRRKVIVDHLHYWILGWPLRNVLKEFRVLLWAGRLIVPTGVRSLVWRALTSRKEPR